MASDFQGLSRSEHTRGLDSTLDTPRKMKIMESHRLRYLLIFGALVVLVLSLVVCGVMKITDPTVLGPIAGAIGVLIPALIDAKLVENRRADPEKVPVADDVH